MNNSDKTMMPVPSELSGQLLDAEIDAAHQALAKAEAEALQVQQRIARIPGLANYANRRRAYGELPNPFADGTLTAQALVQREDPALAAFLANRAGKPLPAPNYAEQERLAKRDLAATRMAEETERLKARNAAKRAAFQHREKFGQWDNFHGRWI